MPAAVENWGKVQQQNVDRTTADGFDRVNRLLRGGEAVGCDFLTSMLLEGRLFVVNYGTGTTYVSGVTSVTATEPQFELDVPSGTTVLPVWLHLNLTAMSGTVNNVYVTTSTNLIGAGTSTATTIYNARQQPPFTSNCTARQAYAGAGTAPAGGYEIFHWSQVAANGAGSNNVYDVPYQFPPLAAIVGPGALAGYAVATSTAPTFQVTLAWIELPTGLI